MKHKIAVLAILALALVFMGASLAQADPAVSTAPLTLNAEVSSLATLTLSVTAIHFPNADPTATPSIAATENGAAVTASIRTGSASTATLTVLTTDDLKSGSDTIPITAVTSTATNGAGSFFLGGPVTWSKTVATPATVGSIVGSGYFTGTFNWFLANNWTYPTGTYTASATYTLTAP